MVSTEPLGDDLDDGLVYDVDDGIDDSAVVSLSDEESKKRTLDEESSEKSEPTPISTSKRQKKLQKSNLHQKKLEKIEYDRQQKANIPRSPTDVISEYFATLIREKNPDLSALELDEMYLRKTDFISTEKYEKERTIENFQNFIDSFSKSPRAIILCQSNMRVADVFRNLGGAKNAVKLFSKSKLKDDLSKLDYLLGNSSSNSKGRETNKKQADKQIKYLISTPNRMSKILQSTDILFQGKEKLDIFLDATYLDPKANTILTGEDNAALQKVLKEFLIKKSSVKVLLF